MNWFMPAFVSSRPVSGGGISDEDGTRLCPRSSKNAGTSRGCRRPSTARSLASSHAAGASSELVRSRGALARARPWRAYPRRPTRDDELGQIEQAALGLAGERRRRDTLRLLLGPARGDDRGRRAGAQTRGRPRTAVASRRTSLLAAFRERPSGGRRRKLMIFTSGPEAASSTKPESFSTRPDDLGRGVEHDVDAIELTVRPLTEVLTSRSNGTSPRASRRSSSSCSRGRGTC